MGKTGTLAALAAGALLIGAAPAAGAIWTEVPSGTTSEITAIEYQSDTRLWFTTASGQIWRRRADLTGFQMVYGGGLALRDIEFQAGDGLVGFAVGVGGTVLRSGDGGMSWARVSDIRVSNVGDGSGNWCTTTETLGDVNFVRFAGPDRVWIGGPRRQLATSQPVGGVNLGATGTWRDANRKPVFRAGDNCWITQASGFADMFVTADQNAFYLATGGAAALLSTDNLQSTPIETGSSLANAFNLSGSIAGDPSSPNRMWSVVPAPYENSSAVFTEDGWTTKRWIDVVNDDSHPWPTNGPYDVAFAGGTVVMVGNEGFIVHSTNGREFFWNGAEGGLERHAWRSVALASGTQAAVGGAGGRLLLSTSASSTPDLIRPTGFISGPGTAVAGQPTGFQLIASDEGGSGLNAAATEWTVTGLPSQTGPTATFVFPTASSYTITARFSDNAGNVSIATRSVSVARAPGGGTTPPPRDDVTPRGRTPRGSGTPTPPNAGGGTTTTTGGTTVTTYRRISLRRGRFVPVWVSAKTPRRYTIEIRTTGRRPRRVASARGRLRANSKKLVRVGLRRSIRTGKYVVTVKVFQGRSRRAIGRRVRTAFVINP